MTLDDMIKQRGVKRGAVAKALRIAPMTLSRKLRGEREFTTAEAAAITEFLRLTPDERDSIFFADGGDK